MIRLRTVLTCPMMGRSWAFDSFLSVFSAKPYDYFFLEKANEEHQHELAFFETHPSLGTVALANGFPAICVFVNDQHDAPVLQVRALGGTILGSSGSGLLASCYRRAYCVALICMA